MGKEPVQPVQLHGLHTSHAMAHLARAGERVCSAPEFKKAIASGTKQEAPLAENGFRRSAGGDRCAISLSGEDNEIRCQRRNRAAGCR
jgi:hypothetical protein